MIYRMSTRAESLSFPPHRASFYQSRTLDGTLVLHAIFFQEREPEMTLGSNSQLKNQLMPHHYRLCKDQIMFPPHIVDNMEDIVGTALAVAPIMGAWALMRMPMSMM